VGGGGGGPLGVPCRLVCDIARRGMHPKLTPSAECGAECLEAGPRAVMVGFVGGVLLAGGRRL